MRGTNGPRVDRSEGGCLDSSGIPKVGVWIPAERTGHGWIDPKVGVWNPAERTGHGWIDPKVGVWNPERLISRGIRNIGTVLRSRSSPVRMPNSSTSLRPSCLKRSDYVRKTAEGSPQPRRHKLTFKRLAGQALLHCPTASADWEGWRVTEDVAGCADECVFRNAGNPQ